MARWPRSGGVFYRYWGTLAAMAVLLLAGVACAVPATPAATPQEVGPLALATATAPQSAPPKITPEPQPAVPEQRLLTLEWPAQIRKGDAEIIRLSLEVDQSGRLTPTAFVEGNQVLVEPVQIPNLYDTHRIVAEARLDIAGLDYTPVGEISEALLPGKPVLFIWSVRPSEIGRYRGTVWLHLFFIPLDGGPESRSVLSAQLVEIEAVNLLGLGGNTARLLGGVGTVLGSMLSLDSLLPWLWKLLRGRKSRLSQSKG